MIENIQAIYKNGAFHPLKALDLPEDRIVEIDVRDISEKTAEKADNKLKIEAFEKWMSNLNPDTPNLTDEQISRESIYEEQIERQS